MLVGLVTVVQVIDWALARGRVVSVANDSISREKGNTILRILLQKTGLLIAQPTTKSLAFSMASANVLG